MSTGEAFAERLYEMLLHGDRASARGLVDEAGRAGLEPENLVTEVFWPVYERLDKAFRADEIAVLPFKVATRLLRMLVDQASAKFDFRPPRGRRVFATSGVSEIDEIAGQIACDLLEASGFEVVFAGGGVANDEVLALVQREQPDVLFMFGSSPEDLASTRKLIDTINEIGAATRTQIVLGGGVYNRAHGLAEEMGADLWGTDPLDVIEAMIDEPERRATEDQRTVGKAPRPTKGMKKAA